MYFSKSRYCSLCQCPKSVWLKKFKPDEYEIDESVKARMDNGNVVGDFAMGLLGDYVEVTATKENGALDLSKMIEKPRSALQTECRTFAKRPLIFAGCIAPWTFCARMVTAIPSTKSRAQPT